MRRIAAILLTLISTIAFGTCASAEAPQRTVLVAYFSATNHTEGVAKELAESFDADLYEIVPEVPYADEDLDYGNADSRTSIETDDPTARPAIAGELPDLTGYDVIFLGYPIWWGNAPRILSTFVESVDFSGKTIAPFCTSGSSDFGDSDAALREAAPDANWLEGHRFPAGADAEEIMAWVNSLDWEGKLG